MLARFAPAFPTPRSETGWTVFWMLTTLLAIPGLLLLLWLWHANAKETPPS